MQTTYPKRKPAKPVSHYILPFTLIAVMAILINALYSMAIPDPLGEKIQSHMGKFQKKVPRG